jgi:hypothetical protein
VVTSSAPPVFEVTGEGGTDGSATFYAGGKAVGKGVAEVTVRFKGSTNGLGTPTTFTITVDQVTPSCSRRPDLSLSSRGFLLQGGDGAPHGCSRSTPGAVTTRSGGSE